MIDLPFTTVIINLAIVLGLILLIAWGFKGLQRKKPNLFSSTPNRLELKEMMHVGNNRHLLIVRCDYSEYLIMTGPHGDVVIQPNLPETPVSYNPKEFK